MRLSVVMNCAAFASMLVLSGAATAAPNATPVTSISGSVVHANLAVYFVRGESQPGPVPLTLAEALSRHLAAVRETGHVNALQIENLSDKPIFVQAGDIVKGRRQDRTLAVSLLLPPKSGPVPIASFCIEHGRWSKRVGEDSRAFASAHESVPSRAMKLAVMAPLAAASPTAPDTALRQHKVWADVRRMQEQLSANTGTDVRAAASQSSLQLALENKKFVAMRGAYIKALKGAREKDNDIIGYVIAVNSKLNSGDVYISNGLFRNMGLKMLKAGDTEAIGQRHATASEPPGVEAVRVFLASAKNGHASEKDLAFNMHRVMHAGDKAYLIEATFKDSWVHRSYLAK